MLSELHSTEDQKRHMVVTEYSLCTFEPDLHQSATILCPILYAFSFCPGSALVHLGMTPPELCWCAVVSDTTTLVAYPLCAVIVGLGPPWTRLVWQRISWMLGQTEIWGISRLDQQP